ALHRGGEHAGALHPDDVLLDAEGGVRPLRRAAAEGLRERAAAYLAPEAARQEAPSTAADVYSLGAVLFELLTGKPPFQAATPGALRVKHAIEPPPDPRAAQPALTEEVAGALRAALAKDPARRPAPAELAAALRAAAEASPMLAAPSPIAASGAPALAVP